MAKIKLSMMVSEMRGKLNGSVFSKNRGGAYVRTKVTPVNPSTTAQGVVRAALTSFSQGWRALTASQRDAWNGAVQNWASTDIFGDIKNPSGINLYTKLNLNLASIFDYAGAPPLTEPPIANPIDILSINSIVADASTPELTIDCNVTIYLTGTVFYVEATPMLSPGVSNLDSRYNRIGFMVESEPQPFDILAMYTARYGALVAGMKIGIRLKGIDAIAGNSGPYVSDSIIISA